MNVWIDRNLDRIGEMFNHEDNRMAERIVRVFGDRPVRIVADERGPAYGLTWAATNVAPDTWTQAQADGVGVDLDTCNQRGITIVNYGTLLNISNDPFTAATWEMNDDETFSFYDIYQPVTRTPEAADMRVTFNDDWGFGRETTLLEYAPRLLVHLAGLSWMANYVCDWRGLGTQSDHYKDMADGMCNLIEQMWAEAMVSNVHDQEFNTMDIIPPLDHEQVATIVRERTHSGIRTLRDRIDQRVAELTDLEQQLITIQDTMRGETAQLEAMMRNRCEISDDDVKREIEAITRHVYVNAFYLIETPTTRRRQTATHHLVVMTKQIPLEHPHGEYPAVDMGPYEIKFSFGQSRSVAVTNQGNKIGEYDHPHIRNGSFCAGNWQTTVDKLLSEGQLASSVNFITACLEQVNAEDSWGSSYRLWFEDAE